MEVLEKIFDPYFTTKKEGSGLGLAVSRSIVERHGGRLIVDSAPGRGALFEIVLPAATARKEPAPPPPAEETFRGKGRVLVMDDEESVREVAIELMAHLGYEVDAAGDGEAALNLYRAALAAGKPYDAVVLDLVVPAGLSGEETLGELRRINPEVRAIVSSGYSDSPAARDHRAFGFCAVLPKPYRLPDLSRVLHEVVSGACVPAPFP